MTPLRSSESEFTRARQPGIASPGAHGKHNPRSP
jgi:hypothetical protein